MNDPPRRIPPSPRVARKEAGRVDILQAAAGLLATHGYHGMSMRDLAAAAGMSLANLYNYFGSKEDLLFALQTRSFETLIAIAAEVTAGAGNAEAQLHAFILSHVRYVSSHRDVMRVLVEEAGGLPPAQRRAVRALKERYFRLGLATVRAAQPRGRPAGRRSLERITYSIFGMLNWVYAWYEPGRHGSPHEVARTIHRLAMTGMAGRASGRASLTATERHVERVAVRSPIHLHPPD